MLSPEMSVVSGTQDCSELSVSTSVQDPDTLIYLSCQDLCYYQGSDSVNASLTECQVRCPEVFDCLLATGALNVTSGDDVTIAPEKRRPHLIPPAVVGIIIVFIVAVIIMVCLNLRYIRRQVLLYFKRRKQRKQGTNGIIAGNGAPPQSNGKPVESPDQAVPLVTIREPTSEEETTSKPEVICTEAEVNTIVT